MSKIAKFELFIVIALMCAFVSLALIACGDDDDDAASNNDDDDVTDDDDTTDDDDVTDDDDTTDDDDDVADDDDTTDDDDLTDDDDDDDDIVFDDDDDNDDDGCAYTSEDGSVSGSCSYIAEKEWDCQCEGDGSATLTVSNTACEDAVAMTCDMVDGDDKPTDLCATAEDCPAESLVKCVGGWDCVDEKCEYQCSENNCRYYINGEVDCTAVDCTLDLCDANAFEGAKRECRSGAIADPVCKEAFDDSCVWMPGECPCTAPAADCPEEPPVKCSQGRWTCTESRCAYSCNSDSCIHYETGDIVCAVEEGKFCECIGSGAVCRKDDDCPDGLKCDKAFGTDTPGKCY